MLSELDSMLHKLVAIVVAVVAAADAVVVDVVVVDVVGDAIADCSFVAVDGFVADGDHVGLENLNFDNFPYSAKKIKISLENICKNRLS